jgi:transcription antitermination factor NusG
MNQYTDMTDEAYECIVNAKKIFQLVSESAEQLRPHQESSEEIKRILTTLSTTEELVYKFVSKKG